MKAFQTGYKKLPNGELEFTLVHGDDALPDHSAAYTLMQPLGNQSAGLSLPDSGSLSSVVDNSQPTLGLPEAAQSTASQMPWLVISAANRSVADHAATEVDAPVTGTVDGVESFRFTEVFRSVYTFVTGGNKTVSDYYSGSADGTAGYDIWVHFSGNGWTQTLQKAFIDTANYFTSVITADIGGGGIVNGRKVDDLYVSAELASIDGVGGILGQAGPTNVWSNNELTAAGQMRFDSADASTYQKLGLWDDIVTHEFMHVLGFGSLWNYGANPLAVVSGQYTGAAGLSAYNQATGTRNAYVPVETDGGAGTANTHWDEAARGNELMTGYINNSNVMSKYSVMSLADLGYQVSYKDYQYDNVVIG